MRSRSAIAGCALLVVLTQTTTPAQEMTRPRGGKSGGGVPSKEAAAQVNSERADEDLTGSRQDALNVLNELAGAADDIKSDYARIKVQAEIADTLWIVDESRARALFEKAFNALGQLKDDKFASQRALAHLSRVAQLRGELLRRVSAHDPAFAEKLLKSQQVSGPEREREAAPAGDDAGQAAEFLRLASLSVESDPLRAAALTRTSIGYGLNPQLAYVLERLRGKSPETADGLCLVALAAAEREVPLNTTFVNYLGPYVFPSFGQTTQVTTVNDALAVKFLDLAYRAVTQPQPAAYAAVPFEQTAIGYLTALALAPYIARYAPERAGVFNAALARRSADFRGRDLEALNAFVGSSDVEELLKIAGEAQNRELKDSIYAKAAGLASQAGEVVRAFSAADKIDDEDIRVGVRTLVGYNAAMAALREGDTETGYKYARELNGLPARASAFSELARVLALRKDDRAGALKALDEVRKSVEESRDSGAERLRAALTIASAAARVDAQSGLEFVQFAVKLMNDVDIDLETLSSPTSEAEVSYRELIKAELGLNRLDLGNTFSLLAGTNYPQTMALARSIENKETSALAKLAAVKALLNRAPERKVVAAQDAGGAKGKGSAGRGARTAAKGFQSEARAFIEMLTEGNFYGAAESFDDRMKGVLPAYKLQEQWKALHARFGAFKRQLGTSSAAAEGHNVVTVGCQFEDALVNVRVVYNARKQITGLFFLPTPD